MRSLLATALIGGGQIEGERLMEAPAAEKALQELEDGVRRAVPSHSVHVRRACGATTKAPGSIPSRRRNW